MEVLWLLGTGVLGLVLVMLLTLALMAWDRDTGPDPAWEGDYPE